MFTVHRSASMDKLPGQKYQVLGFSPDQDPVYKQTTDVPNQKLQGTYSKPKRLVFILTYTWTVVGNFMNR